MQRLIGNSKDENIGSRTDLYSKGNSKLSIFAEFFYWEQVIISYSPKFALCVNKAEYLDQFPQELLAKDDLRMSG